MKVLVPKFHLVANKQTLPSPDTYCKKVDYLHKGTIEDPRDQYTEGDVLRLSCDHGYQLQGHEEIRCLASGQWEHDLPVCKRKYCD